MPLHHGHKVKTCIMRICVICKLGQQAFDDNLYYFAKYYSDLFSDSYSPPYVYDFDNLIKESVITSGIASNRLEQYGSRRLSSRILKNFTLIPSPFLPFWNLVHIITTKNLYKRPLKPMIWIKSQPSE